MIVLAAFNRGVAAFNSWILLTVVGCGAVAVHDSHHVVGVLANEDHSLIATHNRAALAWYDSEAVFYPSAKKHRREGGSQPAQADLRPETCVSFSGGGIRAAAFAIGVMKGLDELPSKVHFWHDVDIISGTSGGSYAVTWYLANLRDNLYTRDTIFSEDALKYLNRHADFIDIPMLSASVLGNLLGIPLNLIGNGFFGWHLNTSFISTLFYERMITNTFHGGQEMLVTDLKPFLSQSNPPLPYPIVTTTWRIDEDQLNQEGSLANSVVEVTPLWYGSDGLGYTLHHKDDQPGTPFVSLAELVEVSGSALDASQSVGASARVFGSAFNMNLGRYFRNEYDQRLNTNASAEQRPAWKKVLWLLSPLGSYLFQRPYWRDAYGERMYLTDGGHAENLAAWPVIRRLCGQIIMVDAEYDPDYTFGAYFRLKHAVENELHTTMQLFPESGSLDVERIEPEVTAKQTPSNFDDDKPGNWRQEISRSHYDKQYAILHGAIGPFPIESPSSGKVDDITLDFIYIKMAVNPDPAWGNDMLTRHYGEDAAKYYLASRTNSCAKRPYVLSSFWKCEFPMYSTLHQNFAPEQFAAYVGLGEHIVKDQLVYDDTCKRLRPARWRDCSQPNLMTSVSYDRKLTMNDQVQVSRLLDIP